MTKPPSIALSAGDPSGDEHASHLVSCLKAQIPESTIWGMGGSHLRDCGVETIVDSEKSASVMGVGDVIFSLGKIRHAFRTFVTELKERKPALLILVDYQEFNLLLAKEAKQLGIPTLFYIGPTVWAWRKGRIKRFKKYIDKLAVIFPFERPFFEENGYDRAVYVGHPFSENFKPMNEEEIHEFADKIEVNPTNPILAILPGSRRKEIGQHVDIMLEGFRMACREIPNLQAVVPIPKSIPISLLEKLEKEPQIKLVKGQSLEVMQLADAGIVKSGTSNLQAAFCDLPFSMFFKAGMLVELAVRLLVERRTFSIVNIIREGTVREFIQEKVTADHVAMEIVSLLLDESRRDKMKQGFEEVRQALQGYDDYPGFSDCKSTYERVAILAQEMV